MIRQIIRISLVTSPTMSNYVLMINKELLQRIFDAFYIQRWNDQIRPAPMIEMDKHAHKMYIAYILAKHEEQAGRKVNWLDLARGGVFDLLRRIILCDIKSPIYYRIKEEHPAVFQKLSRWVWTQLKPVIADPALQHDIKEYMINEKKFMDPHARRILKAAHVYASYWEFRIIKTASPSTKEMASIEKRFQSAFSKFADIAGIKQLLNNEPVSEFIDIVGQLRFQVRWQQKPRIPATSVLGHCMMVAVITYLLTRQLKKPCNARISNNFFAALMHDLPEALTRDIISPVKGSVPGLEQVISEIEKDMVKNEIHPLLNKQWIPQFRYLTEDEFAGRVTVKSKKLKTTSDEICRKYNSDKFQPIDGEFVRAADHLSAFIEATASIEAGISTPELKQAAEGIKRNYAGRTIAGLNIGAIYKNWE